MQHLRIRLRLRVCEKYAAPTVEFNKISIVKLTDLKLKTFVKKICETVCYSLIKLNTQL